MKVQEWEVRRARFSLKEENVYILQGDWPSGYELVVFLDKERSLPGGKPGSTKAPWRSLESRKL
ncbi:MAG: hypothetical protein ACLR2E_23625 [Lachnospiraceae bacterium]